MLLLGIKHIYLSAMIWGPVTHTLWDGGCHWGLLTLQSFSSGSMLSGCSWLVSNFFSAWNLPLGSCGSSCFLATSWAFLPCLLNVSSGFWQSICLDGPLLSCLQVPSLVSDLLITLTLNLGSFMKSENTHFQGWKGSIHNCPYNIPVEREPAESWINPQWNISFLIQIWQKMYSLHGT